MYISDKWAFNPSSRPASDDQHLRQQYQLPTAEPSASIDTGQETSPLQSI
ncbi:hypothetical protein P8843_10870 [Bacillus inaquosorum]|nr:hypothetical protein [Bacillus inaquosorum]MCY8173533.1 hypothetical protein [Bacillus inaquosorum]MCY9417930.1 hypothetical protein [Bacillus inaquosorum]MEC0590727.1 hypothetical protein [Bacillus inaquosorum]